MLDGAERVSRRHLRSFIGFEMILGLTARAR
jgi:hypothetical protein